MEMTLEEKNDLLLSHDAEFYDPNSKESQDHWMNKIRGELVIKIDEFQFANAKPTDIYLISIPCPTREKYKKVQGIFSGKEVLCTQAQSRASLIIRLNILLASCRELIEIRVQRLQDAHLDNKSYSLTKTELIGTALVPWKECAAASLAMGGASNLKKFNEQLFKRRDDLLYVDKDEDENDIGDLGVIRGKVGFVPYH